MIADPSFYALAVPAVLLVGLAKSGFLGGLVVIGVPVLALAVPPVQAAGILLPILLCMDVLAVWGYWRRWDRRNLRMLLPGAMAGIALGYATAAYVSEGQVRLLVGLIALAFVADHWRRRAGGPPSRPSWPKASLAGLGAGFTSFVSHAGSPPYQMYMLPQRVDRVAYAGTSVVLFAVVNTVKLVPYFVLGQLTAGNLATSLALMPLAPVGLLAGLWLVHRVPQEPFYRIAYWVLFVVALKLIWDGAGATFG